MGERAFFLLTKVSYIAARLQNVLSCIPRLRYDSVGHYTSMPRHPPRYSHLFNTKKQHTAIPVLTRVESADGVGVPVRDYPGPATHASAELRAIHPYPSSHVRGHGYSGFERTASCAGRGEEESVTDMIDAFAEGDVSWFIWCYGPEYLILEVVNIRIYMPLIDLARPSFLCTI